MFVAATLSLLAAVAPQGSQDPAPGTKPTGTSQDPSAMAAPLLAEREQDELRKKLREYLADDEAYVQAVDRAREKAGRSREKSKRAFEDAWSKHEKKGNLLGSMTDLRAIFYNCFARERPKHSLATLYQRQIKLEGIVIDYSFWVPKKYKPEDPVPLLEVLPGLAAADKPGEWVKAKDWFDKVWDKSPLLEDMIVLVPQIPQGLEMDPVPDYGREGADIEEDRRNRTLLMTFGEILNNYNVDRGRIFLDCARGDCGYALRVMTLFPDRFAGAVLREPVAVDDIRLGSLTGVPLLLLRTPATKDTVDALHKRIEEFSPGSVTVLDAKGEYPHAESGPDIAEWLKDKNRSLSPKHVVIEPNHDRFNRSYWIDILVADSLQTAAPDKKPRLEATADRAANRITIKTTGVERFELLLNDDLVDLDKEFTIVVNDKPVSEKRNRSFWDMLDRVLQRNDWDNLFPVRYVTTVPKE